ncbi:hypothetical protein [Vibrio taketomensis]|uniref:hypothetical protein n=1 Tax=Vibrio taketomensis TaxID=2572923 RepID=UPI00138A2FC8|nr:hypothetical protein [Vibrio taketomensis]
MKTLILRSRVGKIREIDSLTLRGLHWLAAHLYIKYIPKEYDLTEEKEMSTVESLNNQGLLAWQQMKGSQSLFTQSINHS